MYVSVNLVFMFFGLDGFMVQGGYCFKRKNRLPTGGVMVMKLFMPSLVMPPPGNQLAVVKSGFCCNVQPVEGYGHETFIVLPDWVMVSVGAPAVCTTAMRLQNPPVKE